MGSTAKYSPLDHSGLEVVERSDAPEVVPGSSPPLERKSSWNQPEAINPTIVEHYAQDRKDPSSNESVPAYSDNEGRPTYISPDEKEHPHTQVSEVDQRQNGRKFCGMWLRRRTTIALMVVIALLVLCGVVLGAVLGTVLNKHANNSVNASAETSSASNSTNSTAGNITNSSNAPLEAMSKSGLATAVLADGSGTLLAYYQDPIGRIIENSYTNGEWTLVNSSKIDESIVATDATPGSPLAAISYPENGEVAREVFYVDNTSGYVMATSTTAGNAWSSPVPISTVNLAAPNSIGLAACWDNNTIGLNGIRVYFGAASGLIQETGWTFGSQGWTDYAHFEDSDANSGVACDIYDNASDQEDLYLNLYFRNTTSGGIQQNYYDFNVNYTGWLSDGPPAWSNTTMASGSDVAVCNDDQQNEYVFYQLSSGTVARGLVNPVGTSYESFSMMQGATRGSKLAATYFQGGPLYMFQNDSSTSQIWILDVSANGATIANGFVG